MSKKKQRDRDGFVFSTDPDFEYNREFEEIEDLPAGQQELRVWLDRKNRGGKEATVVKGFVGSEDTLKDLSKMLKTKCGVGGSAKDGEIIIQGDHRDKVVTLLKKEGYGNTKKAGG